VFIVSTVMETGNTEVLALCQFKRDSVSSKICSLLARWVCSVLLWWYKKLCRSRTLFCRIYL